MIAAPRLSVILCTYNRAASLARTLDSLSALAGAGPAWELIVVDNHSTDTTREVVEAARQRGVLPLRYVFEPQQGKSFALNTGIAAARGEILAFTDDDVRLHPDWLTGILRGFEDGCQAVGGRIVPEWPSPPPAWYASQGPHRLLHAIVEFDYGEAPAWLSAPPFGANMAFRRALFVQHGGFRTDLGPRPGKFRLGGGGEDTELCRRLLQAGVRIKYLPRAIVYHPVEPDRMTKRYFKQWYFNYGQSRARVSAAADAPRCFGVPRYLLRELATACLRALCTLGSVRRFQQTLEAHRIAGEIYEHALRARADETPAPVAGTARRPSCSR